MVAARRRGSAWSGVAVGGDDAGEGFALDELLLTASGFAEGGGGEAVDLAQATEGGLVDHGDSVGGEDVTGAADLGEAHADVLGGVVRRERVDGEAAVQAGMQGAIATKGEPVIELGQADEDDGEQGAAVPLVI